MADQPVTAATPPSPPLPPGSTARQVPFGGLAGWQDDNHAAAWQVWLASARIHLGGVAALRTGAAVPNALVDIFRKALTTRVDSGKAARRFFEAHFDAWIIRPDSGSGFFTGYYEPEVEGSLTRTGRFTTPVLTRPPDLLTFAPGEAPPGLEAYAAARRLAEGRLEPYPDRAAIEDGALDAFGLACLFLADPVDLFFIQVQGSGRVRLPDGSIARLVYAGRNGQPYTPIGRIVADRENIPRPAMTMDVLRAWLARDAAAARAVMRENKSYIFFRIATELDPALGPIGGEGLALTPGRSLAVDRTIWPYGLPVHVATEVPSAKGGTEPFRHLTVAQDTGSAILGPARGDIFFGSGDAAGAVAGAMRHAGDFTVLWPKALS